MAEMGTEPDPEPDSQSKIWRLTESGIGIGVLVLGDSAHLWYLISTELNTE